MESCFLDEGRPTSLGSSRKDWNSGNAGYADPEGLDAVEFRKIDLAEALRLAAEMRICAVATPFQEPGWLAAIVSTFPEDGSDRPLFVAGYVGTRCIVLLPLVVSERRGARMLGWLGQDISDYNGPIADPRFFQNATPMMAGLVWKEAAKLAGSIDLVLARKQPVEVAGIGNPFSRVNASAESDRAHMRLLNRPWAEVESEIISKKSRKRLREKTRALAKNGDFEIRAVAERGEIELCCRKLMEWKSDQLAKTGATNPFADPAYRRFLCSVCESGEIELHAAFLDGVPVAVTCMLKDAETWTLYQTGFDPACSRYSVGRVLNIDLLETASTSGAAVFDFGYGDEAYKQPLCDHSMSLTFSLLPLSLRGRFLAVAAGSALTLRRRIKGNTCLRNAALWLKRTMSGNPATS